MALDGHSKVLIPHQQTYATARVDLYDESGTMHSPLKGWVGLALTKIWQYESNIANSTRRSAVSNFHYFTEVIYCYFFEKISQEIQHTLDGGGAGEGGVCGLIGQCERKLGVG
jgi:hypothetical protein